MNGGPARGAAAAGGGSLDARPGRADPEAAAGASPADHSTSTNFQNEGNGIPSALLHFHHQEGAVSVSISKRRLLETASHLLENRVLFLADYAI